LNADSGRYADAYTGQDSTVTAKTPTGAVAGGLWSLGDQVGRTVDLGILAMHAGVHVQTLQDSVWPIETAAAVVLGD